MVNGAPRLAHALIRTHHITSRKKVARLKQAAVAHHVFVLLRSGGAPGIMYVEGRAPGVEEWVNVVQACEKNLRYKDFQLASRPAVLVADGARRGEEAALPEEGLWETDSVRDFGEQMRRRGVFEWWRRSMGWTGQDDRL